MNTPHLYQVSDLVEQTQQAHELHPECGWIPTRPLGFQGISLKRRLKLAWGVFTGRYDAVFWEPTLRQVGRAHALKLYPEVKVNGKVADVKHEGNIGFMIPEEDAAAAAVLAASSSFNQ